MTNAECHEVDYSRDGGCQYPLVPFKCHFDQFDCGSQSNFYSDCPVCWESGDSKLPWCLKCSTSSSLSFSKLMLIPCPLFLMYFFFTSLSVLFYFLLHWSSFPPHLLSHWVRLSFCSVLLCWCDGITVAYILGNEAERIYVCGGGGGGRGGRTIYYVERKQSLRWPVSRVCKSILI